MEGIMRAQKNFLIAVIYLFLGFIATSSLAQQAPDEFPVAEAGSGARLVVKSVSGPSSAIHNQTISVTYYVKNVGAVASGPYKVGLYLSTDNEIDPAADRLLNKVTFSTGLTPGQSRKRTSKVTVPINGLSGNYYYGAVVGTSKKASSEQVFLTRFSLADNNETVIDHQTGLIWQQAADGQPRNWDAANQYCGDLVLGGRANWRLPRIDELQTIVDYSRSDPAIDPLFDCYSHLFWSGSVSATSSDIAWDIYFGSGYTGWNDKTYVHAVRCVYGGP
jgi:hypothetical protein